MILAFPWILLALLLPMIRWAVCLFLKHPTRSPRYPKAGYSSLAILRPFAQTWRTRLAFLPAMCLDVAFIAMVCALARPQVIQPVTENDNATEGIAIEMVLDHSGSMFQEMPFEGNKTSRLEAVKAIFSRFVFGDESGRFSGRPNDLVGLVTFAASPETVCPLTLDHDALTRALDECVLIYAGDIPKLKKAMKDGLDLNAVMVAQSQRQLLQAFAELYGPENARQAAEYYLKAGINNSTAIGDALALGITRLKQADAVKSDYTIASKVLILLTDGENNAGRTVASVASLAQDANVKIYAILIGHPQSADPALRDIAEKSGGAFVAVRSSDELLQVYQDIDALERSQLKDTTYSNTTEYFQPFLWAAICLLFLHILLKTTVFRTLP